MDSICMSRWAWVMAVLALAGAVGMAQVLAQAPEAGDGPSEGAGGEDSEAQVERENANGSTGEEGDASDAAIERLMRQRRAAPEVDAGESGPGMQVELDRSVLGVAPGEKQPELRREGEFIVNRRGHLRRSADGAYLLFVFEADDKDSPEPPMILQPCQLLETMENVVHERGQQIVFILSGQVYTYRGANYLLPTTMRIAVDRDE